jgi:hypothetical protein
VVEDDRGPWWANDPELIEIRRRTVEEFDRKLDHRQRGPQTRPIPWRKRGSISDTVARKRAKEISPVPVTDVADVTRSLALSSPRRRALHQLERQGAQAVCVVAHRAWT